MPTDSFDSTTNIDAANSSDASIDAFEASQRYAVVGWNTIPIPWGEKGPRMKGWPEAATTEQSTREVWFSTGASNIGIATGKKSGIFVLDIDVSKGGYESLKELIAKYGDLPTTATQLTGGGGKHYFFRCPAEGRIRNRTNVWPGIDIRGDGGQVVAAPSVHPNGNRYRWEDGRAPWEVDIADAPDWLLKELTVSPNVTAVGDIRLVANSADKAEVPALERKAQDQADGEPRLGNFLAECAGCQLLYHHVKNAANHSESTWYALLGHLAYSVDGKELAHKISSAYPNYSPEETQAKFDQARKASKPRTCANLQELGDADACRNCPLNGKIRSPMKLAFKSETEALMLGSYVYDLETSRYVNLRTGEKYEQKAFTEKFRQEFSKLTPHQFMSQCAGSRKVDRVDYLPGELKRFVCTHPGNGLEASQVWVLNDWSPGELRPNAGSYERLMAHIEKVFTDDAARMHFLNYLAHIVQYPGIKLNHTILLIGKQGIGKSFFAQLVGMLVGVQNMRTVSGEQLLTDWTAILGNIQVLALEEVRTFNKREVTNKLKIWQTSEQALANEKNVKIRAMRTPRAIFAFSNYDHAVSVDTDDRRWWVYKSPAEKEEDPSYYQELFNEALNEETSAFLDFLLRRDLSCFDPSAPPPVTDFAHQLRAASRSQPTQELEELIEEAGHPFHRDLVHITDVRNKLRERMGAMPTQNQVLQALRDLGAKSIPQFRLADGRKLRYWAVRNADKWLDASPSERLAEATRNRTWADVAKTS